MPNGDEEDQVQGGSLGKVNVDELHNRLGGQLTEWLKLKTDQIEQRVDLRMDGLQREVSAKLDSKPGHLALVLHTVAVIGLIAAILAFGGDRFDGGMSASGAFATQAVERERRDADIDRQLKEIQQALVALKRDEQKRTANDVAKSLRPPPKGDDAGRRP